MAEAVRTLPITTLAAVNNDGIFRGSYNGECFTLSPAMTQQEFREEVRKIDDIIARVNTERAKRQASRS